MLVVPAVRAAELVEAEHSRSRADPSRAGAEAATLPAVVWSLYLSVFSKLMAIGCDCGLMAANPAVTRARFFCCLVFTCDVIKKISLCVGTDLLACNRSQQ